MNKSYQKKYADYYDILYQDKNYEEEIDFLEMIFRKYLKKKPRTVLDLACGTGGHLIPLARRGYQVSGLDLSEGMIAAAKNKAIKENLKINFYRAPMQKFSLSKKFDIIISMFSTVNYLTEYKDLKYFLKNVNNHLSRNGLLIFDVWNALSVLDHYDPYREKKVKKNETEIKRIAVTKIDEAQQLCWVDYHCMIYNNHKKINEFDDHHQLKFFFIDELKNYLEDAGFKILAIGPFLNIDKQITKNDWDISFVVKKTTL